MARKREFPPMECEVCGITFVPRDSRRRTCSRICGGRLGNTKSAREKARQTKLEKYGDPNFNNREKVRKTTQEKYGEEYINSSQVPEIKKKIVDTYTERHGGMGMASKSAAKKTLETTKKKFGVENDESIENVYQIKDVKDKIRKTHEENWGGIGFASEELAERSKKTFKEKYGEDIYNSSYMVKRRTEGFMEKYGVSRPLEVKEFLDKMKETSKIRNGGVGGNNKSIQDKMNKKIEEFEFLYNQGIYSLIEIEDIVGISKDTSRKYAKMLNIELPKGNRLNQTWKLFLEKETGINFELEGSIYNSPYKKVDIYNEELKLGIEINPTITHSTQPSLFHNKKVPKDYHQQRAIEAENNGWNLIQVFDWDNEEDIIDLIKTFKKENNKVIYAKDTVAKEISIKDAKEFTKLNHRQGNSAKEKIAFGLFLEERLVQVMTFSKERFKISGEKDYEIIRMCSKKGVKIVGGCGKLLNYFINSEYEPNRIKTFVDYSKGQGQIYENSGMKFIGMANLNGYYANVDTGEAHKESTILKKFGKEYNKLNLTRKEYMNSKRFYLIHDAGNKIFEWNRNEK